MKKRIHIPAGQTFLFVLMIFAASFLQAQNRYFKGNTHTHCYPQSGDVTNPSYTAESFIAQYQSLGYDFLVFTDHGAWWNAAPLSTPQVTVINGSEAGISGNGRWGHFTGLRMTSRISGAGLTHHALVTAIQNQNAVCFLNHPRWSTIPITARQVIDSMPTLTHVEVFNAVTTGQTGSYDNLSLWDSVLSTGRQLYGVAADDAHQPSHIGKAWIMVYASSNHRDTITEAIRRGRLYASNGIVVDTVGMSDSAIVIKSANGETTKFYGKYGVLLSTQNGPTASYLFTGNELYVRAVVTNAAGKSAWIQPYFPKFSTGVEEQPEPTDGTVRSFTLRQNYPNPANPSTVITYSLRDAGLVTIRLYDASGKLIATPREQFQTAGTYELRLDISSFASGTYFYGISVDGKSEFRKMIVLR